MGDRYRNRGQFTSVWFTRQTGKLVVEVVKKLVKKDRELYLRITWGGEQTRRTRLSQLPHALSSPQPDTPPDRYLSQPGQEIPGLRTVQLFKGSILILTRTKNLMVLGTKPFSEKVI